MFRCLPLLLACILGLTVTAAPANAATPRPVVISPNSSTEVLEGDVLKIRARIPAARHAKRATLERLHVPQYFGNPTWQPVRSVAVKGRARIRFRFTAQEENREKLRVRVETKKGRKKVSKAVSFKVWRWIPLREFTPYHETIATGTSEASVAGRRMPTWGGLYGYNARSWESRYTPGRNCKAFRGIAGLADTSADATTGTVSLFADEQAVWTSPVLTPGAAHSFEVPLTLPYRMALLATNTSPPDLRAFPLIGDPQLLCTGV